MPVDPDPRAALSSSLPARSERRYKFKKPPVKSACLACRANKTRCDGLTPCTSCSNKKRACEYTKSHRGGPRVRKNRAKAKSQTAGNGDGTDTGITNADAPLEEIWDRILRLGSYLPVPLDPSSSSLPSVIHASRVPPTQELVGDASLTSFWHMDEQNMRQSLDSFSASIGSGSDAEGQGGGVPEELANSSGASAVAEGSEDLCTGQMDIEIDDQEDGEEGEDDGMESQEYEAQATVKAYGSDEDILVDYYAYIHPYFPILPLPPPYLLSRSFPSTSSPPNDHQSSSTLSLALSAILSLIPSPSDPHPSSERSVLARRSAAHNFAMGALESVEVQSEILASSYDPPLALCDTDALSGCANCATSLHPDVPSSLEPVLALLLLSVYEYAQRGNTQKMRQRAVMALNTAMSLELHSDDEMERHGTEARRRAWWMTYICVIQGSVVSNMHPLIDPNDPRFTTKLPNIASDPGAWPTLVSAQRCIIGATECLNGLRRAHVGDRSPTELKKLLDRVRHFDQVAEELASESKRWMAKEGSRPLTKWSMDREEAVLARTLRQIARIKVNSSRIKLHRMRAFADGAVFVRRHCDLTSMPRHSKGMPQLPSLGCACSTSPTSTSSATDVELARIEQGPVNALEALWPFSIEVSLSRCADAAHNIALAFSGLPHPPQTSSGSHTPRTMPSFACCAMQGAYALLMLSVLSHSAEADVTARPEESEKRRAKLRALWESVGKIEAALKDYSTAFEAIGGMASDVHAALETNKLFVSA